MRSSMSDIAAGGFALLVAAIFYWQSLNLRGMARDYPMGLLTFITLSGIFLLAVGIYKYWSGRAPISESAPASCAGPPSSNTEPVAYGRVAFILAVSLVYVFLMTQIGFYLASVIFLFGTGIAMSDVQASGGWKKLALASAIFTAIMCISVWIVFVKFLYVPTPVGELIWMLKDLR